MLVQDIYHIAESQCWDPVVRIERVARCVPTLTRALRWTRLRAAMGVGCWLPVGSKVIKELVISHHMSEELLIAHHMGVSCWLPVGTKVIKELVISHHMSVAYGNQSVQRVSHLTSHKFGLWEPKRSKSESSHISSVWPAGCLWETKWLKI